MTELDSKRAQLRLRADKLRERGLDLTRWLEDELEAADSELAVAAIDIELTTREREHSQTLGARWVIRIVWVFVIVVILVHAIS